MSVATVATSKQALPRIEGIKVSEVLERSIMSARYIEVVSVRICGYSSWE